MRIAMAGIISALALGLGGCANMWPMGGADNAETMSQPASATTAQAEQPASADCPPAGDAAAASSPTGGECPPAQTEPTPAPQPQ